MFLKTAWLPEVGLESLSGYVPKMRLHGEKKQGRTEEGWTCGKVCIQSVASAALEAGKHLSLFEILESNCQSEQMILS